MAKLGQIFENTDVKKPEAHPRRETKWIHYTKLVDNEAQYCNEKDEDEIKALAGLIDADQGVLQNLLVRKVDADEYEIIAGHKRRRACRWLVENEEKKQYEFLPCTVEHLSDVQAEFQVYSSNSHHEKSDYEKMHELERMKYLLENYPEEFPHLKTGRMVDRLAKQMSMKRTTVGEYLTIVKNLGEKGKEEFRNGALKKSAAVELSALPKEEQDELIDHGLTSHKEIKSYKEQKEKEQEAVLQETETREEEAEQERIQTQEEQIAAREQRMKAEEEEPDRTKTEQQIPGQLAVVNTDMDVKEDVPDFGTQKPDTEELSISASDGTDIDMKPAELPKETYSPEYFFEEQKRRLDQMLAVQKNIGDVPKKSLERQKLIVYALRILVYREKYGRYPDRDADLAEG